ncbi:SH3 domain-containing C40 family peptidase [Paenibacillus donghaensis]|uniref:Hydrolase n=1 Tax=Paenibacillus donghaensis TaxID=414771 RepID=A0A2Z2KNJ2_9BACL|nr:SH3 domain-containing C40 family peptidase [Paenibacillus donghaensis]ASA24179.1 hydrolase [Paenibacillus donghaensis]
MIKSQKKLTASLLVTAAIVTGLGSYPIDRAAAANASSNPSVTAAAVQTATIEASVRLRDTPSTSGKVISYLKKAEIVTILEKTNNYFYKVRTSGGDVGYTSLDSRYISLNTAPAPVATSGITPSAQNGMIQSSVRLRDQPSTDSQVLKFLQQGDQVAIVEATNRYWYKVRTADGVTGYTSASEQYIKVGSGAGAPLIPAPTPVPTPTPTPAPVPTAAPPEAPEGSAVIETVISTGMRYLGTPYEFGSNRSTTDTFDCSDFIRQIFMEAANLKLPADSRQQGDWVKQNSKAVYDLSGLKRGDLMFFMDYKGTSASDYAVINKDTARISHVSMYLGDGQVLHTYSKTSGGVRVDKLSASWMNRFLYGGSVIR